MASIGWCDRFMRRQKLVIRRKTKIAQKLPKDLEDKLTSFQRFIIRQRQATDFELGQIGNMDETPMSFDMPVASTVNFAGEKTVCIKTTGHEKANFTVVLGCMADGTKLKPMLIFKRKTMPKDEFPPGVIIAIQPKGWMNESCLQQWITDSWLQRPGAALGKKSLLVWDMFRAQLVPEVKDRLKSLDTTMAVIPGGLTSLVQPLDVCLNKPFKDRMRTKWQAWMAEGKFQLTPAGNIRRPELTLVATWVKESWDEIDCAMVKKSFKKCGISNALDGTEDDALWMDDAADAAADTEEDTEDNEDDDMYDEQLTQEEVDAIYTDDEYEDFDGFHPEDL